MLVIGARTVTNLKTVAAGKNYLLPSMAAGSNPKVPTNQRFGASHGAARSHNVGAGALQSNAIYSTQEMSVWHSDGESAPSITQAYRPANSGIGVCLKSMISAVTLGAG